MPDRPSASTSSGVLWLTPPRGTRIDRCYVIEKTIGHGSMGSVVLAHDDALDRRVAIKFARPELAEDAAMRERLRFEAQLMAKVRHEIAQR